MHRQEQQKEKEKMSCNVALPDKVIVRMHAYEGGAAD
jgi:hypothetical protein